MKLTDSKSVQFVLKSSKHSKKTLILDKIIYKAWIQSYQCSFIHSLEMYSEVHVKLTSA